jgi:hypothetical protein
MLRGKARLHYEEQRQRIDQLQTIAAQTGAIAEFQDIFSQAQQTEKGLAASERIHVEKAGEDKVQSYQTEINKQLRLLEIDLMFLRTARQAATTGQRWKMVSDRLQLLIIYCDALLSQDF